MIKAKKHIFLLCFALLGNVGVTLVAAAKKCKTLYFTHGNGGEDLKTLDIATSEIKRVFTFGEMKEKMRVMGSMAVDPTDGTMYGILRGGNFQRLVRIDLKKKKKKTRTRQVGKTFSKGLFLNALAVDSQGRMFTTDPQKKKFFSVDKETAALTEIAPADTWIIELAFNSEDVLYGLGRNQEIFTINTETAESTFIGNIQGMEQHRDVLTIMFDNKDNLHALPYEYLKGKKAPLYKINPTSLKAKTLKAKEVVANTRLQDYAGIFYCPEDYK
jgi:hypothetical protein